MVEKILNNTTPYGKIRASHEGSLHSSTLRGRVPEALHIILTRSYHVLRRSFWSESFMLFNCSGHFVSIKSQTL